MFCGTFLWHVPLVQLKNIGALGYKQIMHDLSILLVYRSHITLPFNGFIIISYTGLQRWDPPMSSTLYATFYEMLIVVVVPYSISQEICTRFYAFLYFVVVIHWLIFPYPSGLLHWHCGNLTIAPVPAKQPWWIWINTSCELIMNDCITTTKQSTTKPRAYSLGYTVHLGAIEWRIIWNVKAN